MFHRVCKLMNVLLVCIYVYMHICICEYIWAYLISIILHQFIILIGKGHLYGYGRLLHCNHTYTCIYTCIFISYICALVCLTRCSLELWIMKYLPVNRKCAFVINFNIMHNGKWFMYFNNSLGPSDAIWRWRSWSIQVQVMDCCLTAPSHYLNQCWLIISYVLWHSSKDIIIRRFENANR